MNKFLNFRAAHTQALREFRRVASRVPAHVWQGTNVSGKPELDTFEIEDFTFQLPVGTSDLAYHRQMIGPNLPWADRHFELDRVSGEPLNPGYTWQEWPYAHKANSFRDEHGRFNHSYAERYWPKLAGLTDQGELRGTIFDDEYVWLKDDREHSKKAARANRAFKTRKGIRYEYGDLNDVIDLLVRNPLTRNAYLPVWFPEDTGVRNNGRTPCSIGYLFRMRDNKLSVFYDIRSCDFVRHFQDDVYLTIRLLLWTLGECRKRDAKWKEVKPGTFTMHIGSFHIFAADWHKVMEGAQ